MEMQTGYGQVPLLDFIVNVAVIVLLQGIVSHYHGTAVVSNMA